MQQRLPLAVLKPMAQDIDDAMKVVLQQRLPLAVLKPTKRVGNILEVIVATALTACGIETDNTSS